MAYAARAKVLLRQNQSDFFLATFQSEELALRL